MDATLLAGIFGLLGAALGALGAYLVKLREDIAAGRAAQRLLRLDLGRASVQAQARVDALAGAQAQQAIAAQPNVNDKQIDELLTRHTPPTDVEPVGDVTSPGTWETDRQRLAARLDGAALDAVHEAVLAVETFNAEAAAHRADKQGTEPPRKSAARALARLLVAEREAATSARVQRVIDQAPTALALVALAAATIGVLALSGVIGNPVNEKTVAESLAAALPGEEIVDCKRSSSSGVYDCEVIDPTCRQAADVPVVCPIGYGRSQRGVIVLVGDAATAGAVTAPGGQGAQDEQVDCSDDHTAQALGDAEWAIMDARRQTRQRSRLREAIDSLVLCIGKTFKRSASRTPTPMPSPTPTATPTPSPTATP